MKYTSKYVRRDEKRGKWQGFLRFKNEQGKWRQTSKTFPATVKTERQARKKLDEWHSEMELEAASSEKASTLGGDALVWKYVESHIETLEKSGNISKHTASDYRGIVKHIKAAFPNVAMRDVTTADIQQWENDLIEQGLSAATVIKIHGLLAACFKQAVAERVLIWNPTDAVKKPKRKEPSPNSLSGEGMARLSTTLDLMEPSRLVMAAYLALHTGMRQGEVCGLRWREYDEDKASINICESIGRAPGGDYSKEPKTKKSRRTVPVSPRLANMLSRRKYAMIAELQEYGVNLSAEEFGNLYVCGYIDGRFYSPIMLSRQWRGLSESLGLRGTQGRKVTFHDLRHSFATRAVANGGNLKAVADVLGHSTISITADVYADEDNEAKRQAVTLIDYDIQRQGKVMPFAALVQGGDD